MLFFRGVLSTERDLFMKKQNKFLVLLLLCLTLLVPGCASEERTDLPETEVETEVIESEELAENAEAEPPVDADSVASVQNVQDIPNFTGEPYVVLKDNVPDFTEEELTTEAFEEYSSQDELGRCGTAVASIGQEIMPTEERGSIGHVKPSGWQTVKYNDVIEGNYLYNRCHLIGFQLAGENANKDNLITGTRYLNVEGMLPFENEVADYVQQTGNHVMYRVTPFYQGDDLVAGGVQMEAYSVEDAGEGVQFNIFCYNVQPQITINYTNGDSYITNEAPEDSTQDTKEEVTYIVNKNTHKFHRPDCKSVQDMKPKNRKEFTGTRDELIEAGYEPCGNCRP